MTLPSYNQKKNPNLWNLETYYEKTESGRHMQYKDIQDEIRPASRYFDIDRRKDTHNMDRRKGT